MQYRVKKGDNLIKILRNYGLNSIDEVLALNPHIKDANLIYAGQEITLPDKEFYDSVPAATVTAEMPKNIKDKKVAAYGQAVKDRKMSINDVPAEYRSDAFKKATTNTDNAALFVLKHAQPWGMFGDLSRAAFAGLGNAWNWVKGGNKDNRHELSDVVFNDASVFGKKFEEEHPVLDTAGNIVVAVVGPAAAEGVLAAGMDSWFSPKVLSANARGTAGNMVERIAPSSVEGNFVTRSVPVSQYEQIANSAVKGSSKGGSKMTSTIAGKGTGKTGTVKRISYQGKPQTNASTKGTIGHKASYVKGKTYTTSIPTETVAPGVGGFAPEVGTHLPIITPRTNYIVVEPQQEEHWEAKWENPNLMIYNTKPTTVVPYKPGMEQITHNEGKAAKVDQPKQRITKEGLKEKVPGRGDQVMLVPGLWSGKPSQYYILDGKVYSDKNGGILKRIK